MARVNVIEIGGALALAALGAFFVWKGLDYPLGSLRRLGPGALPVAMGVAMIGCGGVLMLVNATVDDEDPPAISMRVVASVTAALLAWTLLVPLFGFVVGTIVMVLISRLAHGPVKLLEPLTLAIVLSMAGYLIFVYGLRIPLRPIIW